MQGGLFLALVSCRHAAALYFPNVVVQDVRRGPISVLQEKQVASSEERVGKFLDVSSNIGPRWRWRNRFPAPNLNMLLGSRAEVWCRFPRFRGGGIWCRTLKRADARCCRTALNPS